MVQKIQTYGSIQPQAVSEGPNDVRLRALASLNKGISDTAFKLGANKRTKEGEVAGAKAGMEAGEAGAVPEEKESFLPTYYGEAYNRAQKAAFLASADRSALERLSDIEQQNSHNVEAYEKTSQAMLNGLMQGMPENYRQPLTESIKGYISRGRSRVNENVLKRGEAEAKSELLGSLDSFSREASRAARNGDAEAVGEFLTKIELAGQGLVDSGAWTKEQAAEALRSARNETTEQAFLQIVDDMPLEEAAKEIDDAEKNVPAGFSGDEWDALMARAKVRLQSRVSEEKIKEVSEKGVYRDRQAAVEIAIKTGEGDPDKIMTELTFLFNHGVYTPTQYASNISAVYNDQKKSQKVLDRFIKNDSSIIVEPDAVDKVYRKQANELTPTGKVAFAERVNMVPSLLKAEIKNSLYSGDIDQAAGAAEMIKRMEDIQGLPEILPKQDMAFASQITKLMNVYSAEQAVDMARKNTDPRDKARIDMRKEELSDKDEYDTKFWRSGAESAIGPFFGSIPQDVIPAVAEDYKTVFTEFYIKGMDADDAEEAAKKELNRIYTDFNGRPMKFSPDKYYQVDGSADWVKEELPKELKAAIFGAPSIREFYLITDEKTSSEVATTGRPSYWVRYKTDSGWNVFPKRYYPDIDGQKRRLKDANQESVESKRLSSGVPSMDEEMKKYLPLKAGL